ncbi:MAG: hypothetical protein KC912_10540 [Proteobacteria bacterium]|nr:hypothetical protein [Pseudomonadota bacterium]
MNAKKTQIVKPASTQEGDKVQGLRVRTGVKGLMLGGIVNARFQPNIEVQGTFNA